jgi:hypothetical protein
VLAGLVALAATAAAAIALAALKPATVSVAAAATPGELELVGSSRLLSRGMNSALALHGRYAYVGSRTDGTHPNAGVLVVDVGDPRTPRVVGQIGRPEAANPGESSRELRIWPEQDLLLVLSFECDLVGHLCLGAEGRDVPPTVRFYDIRGDRGRSPRLVATYRLPRNPHELFLWRDPRRRDRALLYVTTPFIQGSELDRRRPHLLVADASRAREGVVRELLSWSPRREGRFESAGLHSLSVPGDGRRAYLADLEGGFAVADTSALARGDARPSIRQLTPPDRAVHHSVPGVHSAVKLPGRPFALTTDEVYGAAFGLATVIGFNVLKGCPWGWSRLIDVRDPARPRIVGDLKVHPWNDARECRRVNPLQQNGASFSSHNPTLTPHLALITWHSAGLQVASLADPARPRQAAEWKPRPLPLVVTEDPALSAASEKAVLWSYPIVRDGLIYVVDIRNGLYVLRYRGPYADELRCRDFLEGNSNAGHAVARCGLRLRVALRYRRGRRGCARSAMRATLRGADSGRARRLDLRLGRRALAPDSAAPFSRRIPARRLPRRRTRLAATVTTADGTPVPLPAATVRRC